MASPLSFSFELFPPRTPEGVAKLPAVIAQLAAVGPEYFSVTHGAGGSDAGWNLRDAADGGETLRRGGCAAFDLRGLYAREYCRALAALPGSGREADCGVARRLAGYGDERFGAG